MSAFGYHDGQRQTVRGILSDGSATTMLSAATARRCIVGIKLVNHSNGALTPVVDIYDATTAFILQDEESLADKADFDVPLPGGFYVMDLGDVLRVTSAANLSWHVSYIEPAKVHGEHS